VQAEHLDGIYAHPTIKEGDTAAFTDGARETHRETRNELHLSTRRHAPPHAASELRPLPPPPTVATLCGCTGRSQGEHHAASLRGDERGAREVRAASLGVGLSQPHQVLVRRERRPARGTSHGRGGTVRRVTTATATAKGPAGLPLACPVTMTPLDASGASCASGLTYRLVDEVRNARSIKH
jgi:hypothetical protein